VCLCKHHGHFGWTSTIFLLYEMTCTRGRGLQGLNFRILTNPSREKFAPISQFTVMCCPYPADAQCPFILTLMKPNIFTVCFDCRVSFNPQTEVISQLLATLNEHLILFGVSGMVCCYGTQRV
jgi:hypothetical protein